MLMCTTRGRAPPVGGCHPAVQASRQDFPSAPSGLTCCTRCKCLCSKWGEHTERTAGVNSSRRNGARRWHTRSLPGLPTRSSSMHGAVPALTVEGRAGCASLAARHAPALRVGIQAKAAPAATLGGACMQSWRWDERWVPAVAGPAGLGWGWRQQRPSCRTHTRGRSRARRHHTWCTARRTRPGAAEQVAQKCGGRWGDAHMRRVRWDGGGREVAVPSCSAPGALWSSPST